MMLGDVLLDYDRALAAVASDLRSIGLDPTTRLKTSGTIIDKLRRDSPMDLRHIRDLAGARIVRPMTLDDQDTVAASITELWPASEVIDRRETPSHGYRAVHVVPKIDGCPVEIQLRTRYQDIWAQAMEAWGDIWGRAIRYGGEPEEPDKPASTNGPLSRREMMELWKKQSDELHKLAQLENQQARLRAAGAVGVSTEELERLEKEISDDFRPLKDMIDSHREVFG
jgi:hypothetical protein